MEVSQEELPPSWVSIVKKEKRFSIDIQQFNNVVVENLTLPLLPPPRPRQPPPTIFNGGGDSSSSTTSGFYREISPKLPKKSKRLRMWAPATAEKLKLEKNTGTGLIIIGGGSSSSVSSSQESCSGNTSSASSPGPTSSCSSAAEDQEELSVSASASMMIIHNPKFKISNVMDMEDEMCPGVQDLSIRKKPKLYRTDDFYLNNEEPQDLSMKNSRNNPPPTEISTLTTTTSTFNKTNNDGDVQPDKLTAAVVDEEIDFYRVRDLPILQIQTVIQSPKISVGPNTNTTITIKQEREEKEGHNISGDEAKIDDDECGTQNEDNAEGDLVIVEESSKVEIILDGNKSVIDEKDDRGVIEMNEMKDKESSVTKTDKINNEITTETDVKRRRGRKRKDEVPGHVPKQFDCFLCAFTCIRDSILKNHMTRMHTVKGNRGNVKCTVCAYSCPSVDELRFHQEQIHRDPEVNPFETKVAFHACTHCSKKFRSQSQLEAHLRLIAQKNMWKEHKSRRLR